MKLKRALLIGSLLIGAAQAAAAQQPKIDPTRLGVDLSRIQRSLQQESASTQSADHGLKIRYTVDVYGESPRLEFFTKADNLQTGPVPYGAPTHREMINQATPIEFRAPIMDFSALLRWLTDKTARK
jgi:hypothetical protein